MDTVKDHLWIWCNETGSNNGLYGAYEQVTSYRPRHCKTVNPKGLSRVDREYSR